MTTKHHDWTIDYRGTFRNRGRCLKCNWKSTMGTIEYARTQAMFHQAKMDEAEFWDPPSSSSK